MSSVQWSRWPTEVQGRWATEVDGGWLEMEKNGGTVEAKRFTKPMHRIYADDCTNSPRKAKNAIYHWMIPLYDN